MRDQHPPSGAHRTSSAESVVTTRAGRVRGRIENGVHRFLGVPYAAAPSGPNRFLPPHPVPSWSGVRDACAHGPTPPQLPTPPPLDAFLPTIAGADYLNVNIWTGHPGDARQPVMVWIPGGGFDTGNNVIYDGSRFARDGIVVVAINYRLGAEGFLVLDDDIANVGLLDQVAALRWVHDNIAAFGGDPDNVTVFGQSSGAMSVGTLLTMPSASGLFHRAIMQSGAGNLCYSLDTAREIGHRIADRLGVDPTREAVAEAEVDRLLAAQLAVAQDLARTPDPHRWGAEPGARVNMWRPTVDGATLPRVPIDAITSGAGRDVDILIGQNAEEGRLSLVPFDGLDSVTDAAFLEALRLYRLPDGAAAHYRTAFPEATPGELLAILQGDWFYRIPAIRLAEARADVAARTYMYEFTWRSPQFDGRLGSCHFLEIPFVFDLLDDPVMRWVTGPNPPQPLADLMHSTWVRFAGTGQAHWPAYEPARRTTMCFDTEPAVRDDPSPIRPAWEGVELH